MDICETLSLYYWVECERVTMITSAWSAVGRKPLSFVGS